MTTELRPVEGWMERLSPEGRHLADRAAQEYSRRDAVALVSAWFASVRRIASASGEDYYDDYFGYVHWRETIDEVIAALPDEDASTFLSVVEPADVQFKECTVDDGGAALSRYHPQLDAERWYWRRVPTSGPIARSLGTEEGI
jgi:hypothetical protein